MLAEMENDLKEKEEETKRMLEEEERERQRRKERVQQELARIHLHNRSAVVFLHFQYLFPLRSKFKVEFGLISCGKHTNS